MLARWELYSTSCRNFFTKQCLKWGFNYLVTVYYSVVCVGLVTRLAGFGNPGTVFSIERQERFTKNKPS